MFQSRCFPSRSHGHRPAAPRRGSTLLIVLVMLTMLTALGVIFYVFAAQERQTSVYFSEAAKSQQREQTAPDALMQAALQQLIVGPDIGTYKNSVLSGRRHALLPNMLGLDATGNKLDAAPYNGQALDSTTAANWQLNDSAGANGGTARAAALLANRDPDYTYPDLNNAFLAYVGYDPVEGRRIILPSFHRPQPSVVRNSPTWYSDSATANYLLRPNANHLWTPDANQNYTPPFPNRYLNDTQAQSLWGKQTVGFPTTPPRDPTLGTTTGRAPQGIWSTSRWLGSASYSVNNWVIPATFNGRPDLAYVCKQAGSSSGTEPVWPTTSGVTVGDGSVTWECRPLSYCYDVDNDGDGIWEGVWLDLGLPVMETAGRQAFVPFVSFTAYDVDALLNLNAHGNMASVWQGDVSLTAPFKNAPVASIEYNQLISKSNLGLMPSEVNPLWGLNRRPKTSAGSTTHDGIYSPDPFFGATNFPANWMESANRDWFYLMMGRFTSTPLDLLPGRWGEENLLFSAITQGSPTTSYYFSYDTSLSPLANPWPGPGQTSLDDNNDAPTVTGGWFGSTFAPFGHPLDFTGLGRYWPLVFPKQLNTGSSNLARWPNYVRYSNSNVVANAVTWPATGMTSQLNNGYALFNQADETVVDGDSRASSDNNFGADEMRALHLSPTDFATATGGQSRLTQLAPFNFDASSTQWNTAGFRRTQEFRSKFTTRSWDRKQFSLPYNSARAWEYNADSDSDGKLEFPPRFGSGGYTLYSAAYPAQDPFRPVLRKLLETELNNNNQTRYQLRLNINQLLVGPNGQPFPTVGTSRPPNITLSYRPLTPHPDPSTLSNDLTTSLSLANGTLLSYPPNGNFGSVDLQEYWARVDRQLMCRDLFVLLYTLTWPEAVNPTVATFGQNPTSNANAPGIRQLAQYAVNIVDSLDRDNVITRFEFDYDLSDGWNLDDYPYLNEGTTDRGEVYGVERLDLTLSEALAVRAESDTANFNFTKWDDTVDRHWGFVELQNPGPNTVNLSNRAWQIEFGPDYTDRVKQLADPTNYSQSIRRLQLRAGTVSPGNQFTIGSADLTDGTLHPSIMKIDTANAGNTNWDTDQTLWVAPNQKPLSLDLLDSAQATQFSLKDATGTTQTSLYDAQVFTAINTTVTNPPASPLYARLYRRLSPDRPSPTNSAGEADNPYVLVDEIAIPQSVVNQNPTSGPTLRLNLDSGDTQPQITAKLSYLQSRKHGEPFNAQFNNGDNKRYDFTTASGAYANTLGDNNGSIAFREWQRVFDRDFASLGELLQITLGGFSETGALNGNSLSTTSTTGLGRVALPTLATSYDTSSNAWVLKTAVDTTAATVDATAVTQFFPQSTGTAGSVPRWYRFLELVEVPTRMHAGITGFPSAIEYQRTPGKININTIRHPEVLAALIDDPSLMELYVDEDINLNGVLDPGEDTNGNGVIDVYSPQPGLARTDLSPLPANSYPENITNWWLGLISARDGSRNPSTGIHGRQDQTGLYLPGTIGSASNNPGYRPFRSFAAPYDSVASSLLPVEDTLLRSWQGDAINPNLSVTANDARGMFELGTANEHRGKNLINTAVNKIDPYLRQRVLSKVMNNVTNRSHVFVVFMSIKYFRANVRSDGAVQIGGPLKEFQDISGLSLVPPIPPDRTDPGWQPELRGFFVVDRSQIEKAYDPATGKVNFRPLVEFQQILQQ